MDKISFYIMARKNKEYIRDNATECEKWRGMRYIDSMGYTRFDIPYELMEQVFNIAYLAKCIDELAFSNGGISLKKFIKTWDADRLAGFAEMIFKARINFDQIKSAFMQDSFIDMRSDKINEYFDHSEKGV